MATLNRRDFFKALGLTGGASALSACGIDNNLYPTPIETVLPYVVRPEQITPGTPTFFATTIGMGPHAYPVLARHREGRVIHLGANRKSPMAPAIPGPALLGLQRLYSPDRLTGPSVAWDAGLKQLSDAVKAAKSAQKTVAYLGPYRSGAITQLIGDYTDGHAYYWEPTGPEAEAVAAEILFGERALPAYDLSKAHYVLSFGAEFLTHWGGAQSASQYADARNPNKGHFIARFALAAAHRDQSGVNSDDWYAIKPGAEAQVALAVAKIVASKKSYHGPAASFLASANVTKAAEAAGIEASAIEEMAAQFAAAPHAVALPGGTASASAAAVDLAIATYVLNIVSGNAGHTFGSGGYAGPISTYGELAELIAEMKAGKVDVLLLDDTNPVYALPQDAGFVDALAKVKLVVGLSSHPSETQAKASLKLPTSNTFEDWGDEALNGAMHLLRQPAMLPLNDTKSLGDILLATAKSAGLSIAAAPIQSPGDEDAAINGSAPDAEALEAIQVPAALGFTPKDWAAYLQTHYKNVHFAAASTSLTFAAWWAEALGAGFVQTGDSLMAPVITAESHVFEPAVAMPGDDFHLIAYPHPHRWDGRFSNEPWAQESPDPTTGLVWDSWVLVHPTTAQKLGLKNNSLVTLTGGTRKMISLGVEIYQDIRPDTVAVAFGQGHTESGRYANGYGVNVVDLLKAVQSKQHTLAWQQTKVTMTTAGLEADLVGVFGSDTDELRQIAPVAPAAQLAAVGDSEAQHPGELNGIHHLARDPRLIAANKLDMYPIPSHPINRWGMTVDVNACNGCGVCALSCSAENNLAIIGKEKVAKGRLMNWIRINRYVGYTDGSGPSETRFMPVMCQQCAHAPCESVCPVLATYHTIDGLNAMVYNRCAGTRYCANACPFKARRFNWHSFQWPEPFQLQLNPDVMVRTMGVMEKCSFCVQRIRATQSAYRDEAFTKTVPDETLQQLPACAEACPSQALTFGNLNDPESTPAKTRKSARSYEMLAELNIFSAVNYLAKASFHASNPHHGAAAKHGDPEGHGAKKAHGEPSHKPAAHDAGH